MDYGYQHPDGGHTYMAVPRTPPQASHKIHRGSPIQLLEELCHKNYWEHPFTPSTQQLVQRKPPIYYYKVSNCITECVQVTIKYWLHSHSVASSKKMK